MEINCVVVNEHGLHTRSAAKIVELAEQFESEITLKTKVAIAEATDMMKLLLLEATNGSEVTISAIGSDEELAIQSFSKLFAEGFNE